MKTNTELQSDLITKQANSSFFKPMWMLPRRKQKAMFTLYAVARTLDDIADDYLPTQTKIAKLESWQQEIELAYAGAAQTVLGSELQDVIKAFNLPKTEFALLLQGLMRDATDPPITPTVDQLKHYCRCVAGSVGVLSLSIFGATSRQDKEFALNLAEALQLTNILRDVKQDAQHERCYLPKEYLHKYGIYYDRPKLIAKHKALPFLLRDMALENLNKYQVSKTLYRQANWLKLWPAWLMLKTYEKKLEALIKNNFNLPFIF